VLDTQPSATRDADIVALLRRAGFIVVGKTNMTEFAYSGLGMNAHFGTPLNPFDRASKRIPGWVHVGRCGKRGRWHDRCDHRDGYGRIMSHSRGLLRHRRLQADVHACFEEGCDPPFADAGLSVGPLAGTVSCCAVLDSILSGGVG